MYDRASKILYFWKWNIILIVRLLSRYSYSIKIWDNYNRNIYYINKYINKIRFCTYTYICLYIIYNLFKTQKCIFSCHFILCVVIQINFSVTNKMFPSYDNFKFQMTQVSFGAACAPCLFSEGIIYVWYTYFIVSYCIFSVFFFYFAKARIILYCIPYIYSNSDFQQMRLDREVGLRKEYIRNPIFINKIFKSILFIPFLLLVFNYQLKCNT